MAKRKVATLTVKGPNGDYNVVVDRKLLPELMRFTWKGTAEGYAYRKMPNGKKRQDLHYYVYETHGKRQVPKGKYLDHANQDKCDNRLRNLQVVDDSGKNANAPKHRDNTTGFKDVVKTDGGKFKARVSRNSRRKSVGTYATRIEAAHAVNYAYKKLHPEIKIPQNKIRRVALSAAMRAAVEANVDRLLRRG